MKPTECPECKSIAIVDGGYLEGEFDFPDRYYSCRDCKYNWITPVWPSECLCTVCKEWCDSGKQFDELTIGPFIIRHDGAGIQ